MNETVRGSAKSKTILGNGAGIIGLITMWNSPELAMLPDKAKYIILGVMAANIILRYLTDKSIQEKGQKKSPLEIAKEALIQVVSGGDPEMKKALQQLVLDVLHPEGPKPEEERKRRELVDYVIKEINRRTISQPSIAEDGMIPHPASEEIEVK